MLESLGHAASTLQLQLDTSVEETNRVACNPGTQLIGCRQRRESLHLFKYLNRLGKHRKSQ